MRCWFLRLSVLCLTIGIINIAQAQECGLKRLVELPTIESDIGSPIVSILIDDQPRNVLIDTGGFWSLLNPSILGGDKSRISEVEGRLGLNGIELKNAVKASSVQIGPLKLNKVDFLIAPDGYLTQADGTLGENWLHNFDVEIDPVNKKVSLFSKDHCEGKVVYWPHRDIAETPIRIDFVGKQITIPLILNGKEITALIDTGSSESILNLRAADRLFDLTPESPGVEAYEGLPDKKGKSQKWYRYKFKSLEMGDITFKNPFLTLAPMSNGGPDLILGMHQLRGLHLYFAYGEKKLYATTASGDIAALQAKGDATGGQIATQPDPLSITNAQDLLQTASDAIKKKDYDAALAATNQSLKLNPNYPLGYTLRANIYFLKGQRDLGIKDLASAIQAYIGRAKLYAAKKQYDLAIEDLNQALKIDPKNLFVFIERGQFYRLSGDYDHALADANEAVQIDPRNADAYMFRAITYQKMEKYELAFADADHAVQLQPKSPRAFNDRCWIGAILGRFESALADCNAAIELAPNSANIIDSRAFVHFRAGQLDLALADYNAALVINPGLPSSLYGRGLVKQQKGDAQGGAADIAAAQQADPNIAQHFGK